MNIPFLFNLRYEPSTHNDYNADLNYMAKKLELTDSQKFWNNCFNSVAIWILTHVWNNWFNQLVILNIQDIWDTQKFAHSEELHVISLFSPQTPCKNDSFRGDIWRDARLSKV